MSMRAGIELGVAEAWFLPIDREGTGTKGFEDS